MRPIAAHEMGWVAPRVPTEHGPLRAPGAWTMLDLLWEDITEIELEMQRLQNQLDVTRELLSVALTRLYALTGGRKL